MADFDEMFSVPTEPETSLGPGQFYDLQISEGRRVLITDIYVENLSDEGPSTLRILQQAGPNSFEVRYAFHTPAGQVTILHFRTGLRLGDQAPIEGAIRVENEAHSPAIIARVNGLVLEPTA